MARQLTSNTSNKDVHSGKHIWFVTFKNLEITVYTATFNNIKFYVPFMVYLYVLYGTLYKHWVLPHITLTAFFHNWDGVYCAVRTGSLNETDLLVILKGLNNIILWCGNKQACTVKPPNSDICVAIWFTLTTQDVITKCWVSFVNDNWIYQLLQAVPFKVVPPQLDTMSPANVQQSKAFVNILHIDLCKCSSV
jgi:hypothetical protein